MSVFRQLMMKKKGSKIYINPKLIAIGDGITIDNGIATSSDNSYLKINYIFDINHYNTWKFKTKVYFKSLQGNIFANINQDQVGFRIGTDSDRNRYYMLISISKGSWNRNVSSANNVAVTNVWTWVEAEYTGSNYILRTSTDGEIWTEQINVSMGTKASNGDSSVYGFFGSAIPGSTEFLNGYIDLMETKLYANGELWFECANDTGIFTMPLTKVGSPTITDGIVSGFSSSNYLSLQQPFKLNADTVAEFVFKINISTIVVGTTFFGTLNSYGIVINMSSSGKLSVFIGDGSSWSIANGILTSSELATNTDYFVKLIFNKQSISLLISTDGINYTGHSTTIVLEQEYIYNLYYGIGRLSGNYFRGSIDFNNSYIKLGSTKYNYVIA